MKIKSENAIKRKYRLGLFPAPVKSIKGRTRRAATVGARIMTTGINYHFFLSRERCPYNNRVGETEAEPTAKQTIFGERARR